MMKIITSAVVALTLTAGSALAQTYPDRPIGVAVSYGAGGATDFQARIVTMVAGNDDMLGQPMYILNKPGSGGRVGWNWFATEVDADGYTLSAYNVPHFIAQSIKGGVKYDVNSFEPIANWGSDPAVVVVPNDSPFSTIQDMVEYATNNPGKVTLSGAGLFVGHHIAFLQFAKASGANLTYIPASGGVDALRMVKAGETVAGFNNLSDSARSAADLKILAVADLTRHEYLPDVPTLMESGVDVDDSSVNFRGLMVPAGTPQDVIDYLASKVPDMFGEKKTVGKMKATNSPARIMNRDEVVSMWNERQAYLTGLLAGLQ